MYSSKLGDFQSVVPGFWFSSVIGLIGTEETATALTGEAARLLWVTSTAASVRSIAPTIATTYLWRAIAVNIPNYTGVDQAAERDDQELNNACHDYW
jgi:hypothetical protein